MKEQFQKHFDSLKKWATEHKKPLLIASGVIAFLLLIVMTVFLLKGEGGIDRIARDSSSNDSQQVIELEVSPTTGQKVLPEIAKRPVLGVMISNSSDARPQSGLDNADIVFEAIAEGGITRYLALFHDQEAPSIGPVRSLRPYYIDWIKAFDATAVHVGGSQEALDEAKTRLVNRDIDEFRYGSSVFERISQRRAPHNTYTSTKKLFQAAEENGHKTSSFDEIERRDTEPVTSDDQSIVNDISVPFSSPSYNTSWSYNASDNLYERSIGGSPHIDDATNNRIAVNALVVIQTSYDTFSARGNTYNDPKTTGSGTAYVFQNGTASEVTWRRSADDGQYRFTNKDGDTVRINKGKIWFAVQPSDLRVSYE